MKPRNNPVTSWWIGIGVLMLSGALCLTLYNLWDENRAAKSAEESLQRLQEQMPQGAAQSLSASSAAAGPQAGFDPVQEGAPSEAGLEMPVIEVDEAAYIGTLSLPRLGLILPVMRDWSDEALRVSPCRFEGSPYGDDMIVIAHNYRRHFGRLGTMEAGDQVSFTSVDGSKFLYEVSEVQRHSEPAMEEIEQGEWDLTLLTCTIEGSGRIVVRCNRLEREDK